MIYGFVLIITKAGKEHPVFSALQDIPEVSDVHPLFGEYDLIARVQGETPEEIGMIVVEKIRTIDGVTETKTMTSIRF